MSKLGILASIFALAVGTVGCGNSQGQSNSLVDVGPSTVSSTPPEEGGGNLATLAKGGRNGGGSGGTGTVGGGGGTISLVLLDSTDGLPHYGQHATFNVSTTATTHPWVTMLCYVGGIQVDKDSNAMFDGSLDTIFTLGGTPSWQSGAADCTATLENRDSYSKNGSITALASTSFHVYP
jgi:hypothetical protein